MAVSADNVQKAYLAYFGRPADPVGLAYWMTQDAATMKAGFAASAEYAALYAGMTSTQMVSQVYTNLLGRAADVTGLLYWSGELAAGRQTVSSLVDSMQANVLGVDVTTVANRLTYATAFTAALDTTAEIVGYSGNTAAAAARTAITSVVDTAASLTAAQAALTTSVATVIAGGTSSTGTTYTLTTGVDSITGTSNNDTILAMSAAGASAATDTLAVSDSIDGGAGTDTLSVTNTASGAATAGALIKNVETINIRQATAGQTSTHDASTTAGVTAVNANLASGIVTVTNLATGASAGMIGDGTLANGAFNAGYVAAATAGVLNLSGGTTAGAVTMSGAGLTSQTINSTGATNVIGALALAATDTSLTVNATTKLTTGALTNTGGAALTTLTVTGAGAVSFGATALEAAVTKIDASANTGGLTVAMGSAVTQAVTGSAGNDVITTGAITLTTGSVNAGAGTDTLDIGANVGSANTASLAAKYTNFETLRVNGTFDASLIAGITAVELSGAVNAITKMTATQAAAVTARADIGATTLALATATGTADVLTLTMGTGTTTAAATNSGALTVTGFETLNIIANPGATATVGANKLTTIASLTGATLNAVNMTGTAVAITNAATTVAATFNASALTGDGTTAGSKGLTLGGNLVTGSTVTGSGFIDTITLGTAGSTYNLGAGADTISGTLAQYRTTTTYNTIDAGAGTDTATISDGATVALTVVDDDFKGMTNVEKITITDTTTGAQNITTGGWFDAGFKAAGATLTTTSTTGAITITAGSFTGNMTLTTTSVGTAAAEGRTTVTTGSGNDTISVTTAAATTLNVITAGAGNDTITHLGASTTTINGGTGADTMTGVAGVVDTYTFANTGDSGAPSATNFDTITNWVSASDIIDFTGAVTVVANATTAAAGVAAITVGSIATFNAADTTLAQHIIAVEAALTKSSAASNGGTAPTALNIATWNEGADAFLFITDGTAGVGAGDTLIKLTGINNTGTFTLAGANVTAIS